MAGSHVGRRKSEPFRVPPAVGQFSHDSGGRALVELAFGFVHNGGGGSSDGADVLQSEKPRAATIGEVEDVEEEPASLAVKPSTTTADREVLTWESGNEAIHLAAKLLAWEGEKVRPDRRRSKGSRFHERDKLSGGSGFPLHVANGSVFDAEMSECGCEAFSEHADTCTQLDGR